MQILTGVSDTFNKDVNRRRYLDITTLSLSKVTGRRSFSLTKAGWQNVIALIDVSHTDSDLNTIVINRNNIIFAITSTVDQLIQQLQTTFPFDYVTSIKHGIGPELDLEDPPPYVAGDFWISPYPGKEPGEQNWLVWAPWDMTWAYKGDQAFLRTADSVTLLWPASRELIDQQMRAMYYLTQYNDRLAKALTTSHKERAKTRWVKLDMPAIPEIQTNVRHRYVDEVLFQLSGHYPSQADFNRFVTRLETDTDERLNDDSEP